MRFLLLFLPATIVLLSGRLPAADTDSNPPNIVIILADDLGYGDVRCYNPERGKIPTPRIDRLAEQGMRFTDAHSSSGVCSPSRYTLLTGRYHWRTRLQQGIVGPFGDPLIAPDRLTVARLLAGRGYRTACIGKWHLGWDWPILPGDKGMFHSRPNLEKSGKTRVATARQKDLWKEVFAQHIPGGPTTRGFGSYFGTDVPNWPPFCFIEDDRTLGIPSQFLPARLFERNLASLQGPALEGWKLRPILPTLADRACRFIEQSADGPHPFFLYLPLTSPHTPLAVNEAWQGKSGLNAYADFVMETDNTIGRVLDALQTSGAAANTLVVLTSDNGCARYIGVTELEQKGHYPSGPLRGYKMDVWEGGHRVPFIVRWPGTVKPGSTCAHLVHHADLMATCAEVVGTHVPEEAGEDSTSLLPLLTGGDQPVRHVAVNQSSRGMLAIRRGPWKLIFGRGSGSGIQGNDPHPVQLYNLDDDLGESKNLCEQRPEVVAELTALMDKVVADGRSTPGERQKNDVPVRWKRFLDVAE